MLIGIYNGGYSMGWLKRKKTDNDTKCEKCDELMSEGALACFGWENVNTQRLLVILAKVWFGIMSLGWFLFGAVTFAPVIFIGGKVNVIFKDKKKSLFVGGVIYAVMIIAIVLIAVARRMPSSAAV